MEEEEEKATITLHFFFVVSIEEHNHGNNYVHKGEERVGEESDDIGGILILLPFLFNF